MNSCFNQFSQSIYDDNEFADPLVKAHVGHQAVGSDPIAFVRAAIQCNRNLYVKTHEPPGADQHPTIYVVRNGLSAVVSHMHFLRDIIGIKAELRDVIEGKFCSSWSTHVEAWALSGRPNTLVVRFENLATGDLETLQAISNFIGHPLLRPFDVSFNSMHAKSPLFFRRGSDEANIAEMNCDDLDLFDKLHGSTLRRIGYEAT